MAVNTNADGTVHTGAMIALVPTPEDAARLAEGIGEPEDQLHLTLRYLGKAADWGTQMKQDVIEGVRALAEGDSHPVEGNGFHVAMFNPDGEEPCIVLGVGGDEVDAQHKQVEEILLDLVDKYDDELPLPEAHKPFIPHITLEYTDDASRVGELTGKTGPVTFDRIRVAFGGDVVDFHFGEDQADVESATEDLATEDDEDKSTMDEVEYKGVRHVRTAAGVRRYKQPIGTVIGRNGSPLTKLKVVKSDYHGFDKVEDDKGNKYYVGRWPGEKGVFVTRAENDNDVVAHGNSVDDAMEQLSKHVSRTGGGSSAAAKPTASSGTLHIKKVKSDYPGYEKYEGPDGNGYYVYKDSAGQWGVDDEEDNLVVSGSSKNDVLQKLNDHVAPAAKPTSRSAKPAPKSTEASSSTEKPTQASSSAEAVRELDKKPPTPPKSEAGGKTKWSNAIEGYRGQVNLEKLAEKDQQAINDSLAKLFADHPQLNDAVTRIVAVPFGGVEAQTVGADYDLRNGVLRINSAADRSAMAEDNELRDFTFSKGQLQISVVHEMGHAAFEHWSDQYDKEAMIGQIMRKFPDLVKKRGKNYIIDPAQAERQLSLYAAVNIHELMAEGWAEYNIKGDKARPLAKTIGELLSGYMKRRRYDKFLNRSTDEMQGTNAGMKRIMDFYFDRKYGTGTKSMNMMLEYKGHGVRRVRTPAGVRRYKQPIGSIIVSDRVLSKISFTDESHYEGFELVRNRDTGEGVYVGQWPGEKGWFATSEHDDGHVVAHGNSETQLFENLNKAWGGDEAPPSLRTGGDSVQQPRPSVNQRQELGQDLGGWTNSLQDQTEQDSRFNQNAYFDVFNIVQNYDDGDPESHRVGYRAPDDERTTRAKLRTYLEDNRDNLAKEQASIIQGMINDLTRVGKLPKSTLDEDRQYIKDREAERSASAGKPGKIKVNEISAGMWVRQTDKDGNPTSDWTRIVAVAPQSSRSWLITGKDQNGKLTRWYRQGYRDNYQTIDDPKKVIEPPKLQAKPVEQKPNPPQPRDYPNLHRGDSEYPGYELFVGANNRQFYVYKDSEGNWGADDENDNLLASGATRDDVLAKLNDLGAAPGSPEELRKNAKDIVQGSRDAQLSEAEQLSNLSLSLKYEADTLHNQLGETDTVRRLWQLARETNKGLLTSDEVIDELKRLKRQRSAGKFERTTLATMIKKAEERKGISQFGGKPKLNPVGPLKKDITPERRAQLVKKGDELRAAVLDPNIQENDVSAALNSLSLAELRVVYDQYQSVLPPQARSAIKSRTDAMERLKADKRAAANSRIIDREARIPASGIMGMNDKPNMEAIRRRLSRSATGRSILGSSVTPEEKARSAYASVAARPGAWVKIASVRKRLIEQGMTTSEADAELRRMSQLPDVEMMPETNQKTLTEEERRHSIRVGGQDAHLMMIDPTHGKTLDRALNIAYKAHAAESDAASQDGAAASQRQSSFNQAHPRAKKGTSAGGQFTKKKGKNSNAKGKNKGKGKKPGFDYGTYKPETHKPHGPVSTGRRSLEKAMFICYSKAVSPGGRPINYGPVGKPGGRQNWVDKLGGLPKYIRGVAHALEKTHGEARAIALAVAAMKRWARGGDHVRPQVQAAAAKALAQWEAMKAKA